LPVFCFRGQALATTRSDLVILGFPIAVGRAPFGVDQFALLEANERGVNGALIKHEAIRPDLFDATCDPIAVHGTHCGERL
jgi:hypothetical protein